MEDALGVDPDIVELLRNAAMAGKSITYLLSLFRLTHDREGEHDLGVFKAYSYFSDAFDWDCGQMVAFNVWAPFSSTHVWPDETIDARYAPLLEAWRKNPSPYPIPEEEFNSSPDSPPLSEAEMKEIMKCLEMD